MLRSTELPMFLRFQERQHKFSSKTASSVALKHAAGKHEVASKKALSGFKSVLKETRSQMRDAGGHEHTEISS